jgi:hypothetical protein
MKKTYTFLLLLTVCFVNAQAYKGKGDYKFQIGANIQNGGSGIQLSSDYGYGENMSFGLVASYLLSVDANVLGNKPEFIDRFDFKARFNANLGDVLNLNSKMDVYPGLNIGPRNFGAHLGFRYFFTDGFGLFSEAGIPIAKYNPTSVGFDTLNNQFVFNIGASFNL